LDAALRLIDETREAEATAPGLEKVTPELAQK
jgi:hypothetical protein